MQDLAARTGSTRGQNMSNAEAGHWAVVHSWVAQMPKHRRDRVQIVSKPLAERHGIVQVQWSHA
ncbi:DUF6555 family protein [Pseudomonas sp. W2-17]|uniref:DUF6555 family protein n=1 Tax=unclassified Pseudomonas TaxID=196821 RepID=UPI0034E05BD2